LFVFQLNASISQPLTLVTKITTKSFVIKLLSIKHELLVG
jgi:hypothetical protein